MIEQLADLTLFDNHIIFWCVSIVVALFMMLTESFNDLEQDKGSNNAMSFVFSLYIVANYIAGNLFASIPIISMNMLYMVTCYILIGFIYSLVRTYFYGRSISSEHKRGMDIRHNIFCWWVFFPTSMMMWLILNMIGDVFDYIISRFRGLYEWVFNL